MDTFTGFHREGIQFLAELADNNNREWFQENKRLYQKKLLEPAQSFVSALGMRLQDISNGLIFDTRTNGSGSLMRIYRDTRFSKDKTPYKTNISMSFWEGAGKKMENPGFFIRFEPSGGAIYTGQHVFDKHKLAAYRDAVVDNEMGAELEEVVEKVKTAGGYEVGGEHYKRVPRGYDVEHPRAGFLKYNGLWALNTTAVQESELYTADLVDVCFQHCLNTAPIHQWLVKLEQRI